MNAHARVCLVGFGSAGDIHPLLAIGRHLRSRGHPVTLLTNPLFAADAGAEGLDFVPVGEERHLQETIRHPKLWHPIDGFGVMWRYLLRPALAPTYERIAQLARSERCVVIASPVAMGARIANEHLQVPLVSVYTAATMLRTISDPMTLAHWRVPPAFPRLFLRAAWALLDRAKLEPLVRPELDAVRGRLGLPKLRESVFGQWMHSPLGGVALFPQWFAPAAQDWPRQVVQAGFTMYDEPAAQIPAALARFLEEGPPPVVFTPGTARAEASGFFDAALKACEYAGTRAVLLGPVQVALARRLPRTVHAQTYAPFGLLLPRARAVVHHGGIGTCAQALRAGVPQLVVPHAYDQFDNAMRLERLGVGIQNERGTTRWGQALRRLVETPSVAQACAQWAAHASSTAALDTVTSVVERLQ